MSEADGDEYKRGYRDGLAAAMLNASRWYVESCKMREHLLAHDMPDESLRYGIMADAFVQVEHDLTDVLSGRMKLPPAPKGSLT